MLWYMVPEIWSMTNRFFCHFGTFFALLLCLTTQKTKNFKKWKKLLEILSLYTHVPELKIIWCMIPEICSVMDRIFFNHFGLFFTFLPPIPSLPTKKIKIKKIKKTFWRFHHFTHVYRKLWSHDVPFLRYGAQWTDSQKDWQTEKVTHRDRCLA